MAFFAGAKIIELATPQEWETMVEESKKHEMVICVDVFKDWSGPCTVMHFFFDRLVRLCEYDCNLRFGPNREQIVS